MVDLQLHSLTRADGGRYGVAARLNVDQAGFPGAVPVLLCDQI
jgi:hypothetical protein